MSEGSKLGGLMDDLVDGLFGALQAPVDLVVNAVHHKPTLSSLHEGPSQSSGSSSPSPSPSPGHGH